MTPDQDSSLPVWAKQDAFPVSLGGYGWLDPKGAPHGCANEDELREVIGNDRDARVLLVWTPQHAHMVLPEEWSAAADAVRQGRGQRLKDD